MQVLVWSDLETMLCASTSSICPPGRQARSGRLGMDLLELELVWSSRAQTGRTGEGERPGIKKEIRTGATTHLPMQLGVGRPASTCEPVVWICTLYRAVRSGSLAAQVWHCTLQAGGINWKGRWTPEATRRSWVPQAKILPWVAAWRQGQGAELH